MWLKCELAFEQMLFFSCLCTFVGLWKIYLCLFIPNCTQNRMITYTDENKINWIETKHWSLQKAKQINKE